MKERRKMEEDTMNTELDIEEYQAFAREKLGFTFDDPMLIVTALTHRSYVNEHRGTVHDHNERVEFLGDAVLELVTSDFLFRNYDEPEGVMTALRSALVCTESISEAGYKLGYEPLVRLSHGEKNGSERAHKVIMADCFEALIGAIYLDKGYEVAKEFIYKHILIKTDEIIEEGSWRDPKSYLQEMTQKLEAVVPVYRTLKAEGPDHDRHFEIGLYVNGELVTVAEGHSKQEAQTLAAKAAVKIYKEKMKEAMGIL